MRIADGCDSEQRAVSEVLEESCVADRCRLAWEQGSAIGTRRGAGCGA
jgi:hypothetical protein